MHILIQFFNYYSSQEGVIQNVKIISKKDFFVVISELLNETKF